jgi:hypothetical protein
MPDYLKDYFGIVTAVVAVVALIRPDIANWRRRLLGNLLFNGKDKIEIGFSQFGPHVGLFGSLISFNTDFCIGDMKVTVVRLKDNKTHMFNWQLIGGLKLAQDVLRDSDVSGSFWLRRDETRSVALYFMDVGTQREVETIVESQRSEFFAFCQSRGVVLNGITSDSWNAIFGEYGKQSKTPAQVYAALSRIQYWQEGKYKIELSVKCIHPVKTRLVVGEFEITKAAADATETNIISTINSYLGSPKGYLPQPYIKVEWQDGRWV